MTTEDRNDAQTLTLWTRNQPHDEDVPWAAYAREVLSHAGFSYHLADSPDALRSGGVVLVTEPVDGEHAKALTAWVRDGGALVITGDPGDLGRRRRRDEPGTRCCGDGHLWPRLG
ncbi:hypothetical protein [Sanguibacter sp. Z1732]|uniref:hypothetical protein n=1 Tax=Sanguibacter sp. Z1732 TaxID=3435412 RepID=UPI003D9C9F6E